MVSSASPTWISPDDWWAITVRLSMALAIGGLIGWNRQKSGKDAGLRTHMLVSLGSALFVLLAIVTNSQATAAAEQRAVQGVATGIGFLGAGEILHQSTRKASKLKVKGLTSAAAIWVTAALGCAAAYGVWPLCLVGTFFTVLILDVARRLEIWMKVETESEEGD